MDENIKNEKEQEQELDLESAIAAAKEEKARMIAKNMAAVSFEDEVIQDNGSQPKVDTALQKATEAVNAVKSDRDTMGARRTASFPAQRDRENDMANRRNNQGARRRPQGGGQQTRNGAPRRRPDGDRRPTDGERRRPEGAKKRPVKKKKKSKVPMIVCLSLLGAIVLGLVITYIVGMVKYKGVFLANTYINNIDVSGKTKEQAYKMVKEKSELKDSITIVRLDNTQIQLPLTDIGYTDKTQYEIEKFYNSQNHYNWIGAKFSNTQFEVAEKFTYDKVMLETQLKNKVAAAASGRPPEDATIQKSTDGSGYVIVKEKPGDKITTDKIKNLYDYVEQSLDAGRFVIDISEVDCYETAKITSDSLKDECDRLNKMNSINITIDFVHTEEVLKGSQIMSWISFDSKAPNGIVVDTKQLETYVEGLSDKYDTYAIDRQFKTTNKGVITIKGGVKGENDTGCYGWWMDQQKTMNLIRDTIIAGQSTKIKPVYYENPDSKYLFTCDESVWTKDKDYGNTYVEIDIAAQHLWYYKDGKVAMESDVVTGLVSDYNRYTREGVYKLWFKEKNKVLRGETWTSPVQYWSYFSLYGAGMHDASWQYGVFGGTKYKYASTASHGCINMPLDKAKYVFENIPLNTPVFVYNIEKAATGAATKPN